MKNLKIIDVPRNFIFCVIGGLEDLREVKEFFKNLPHLYVITCGIITIGSESRMEILCPSATYEAAINLLEDFISE